MGKKPFTVEQIAFPLTQAESGTSVATEALVAAEAVSTE
jgi:hypothetical protein